MMRRRRRRREGEKPHQMSGLENEGVMFLCSKERLEWVRNCANDVLVGRSDRFKRVCVCVCDVYRNTGCFMAQH